MTVAKRGVEILGSLIEDLVVDIDEASNRGPRAFHLATPHARPQQDVPARKRTRQGIPGC